MAEDVIVGNKSVMKNKEKHDFRNRATWGRFTHRNVAILHERLAPPPGETEWTTLSEPLDFTFL